MKTMTVSRAAAICGGRLTQYSDAPIGRAIIDSRQVQPGDMFVAYRGENVDGHRFIAKALEAGAACCLAEYLPEDVSGPVILADDVQAALEKICAEYRRGLSIPVIGITGSVGKTTAKEMISSVLEQRMNVLKTEGNLNNQIGVPMTVSRIERKHEAAVIEMGISGFGEMTALARIAQPTVAVFTVIGHAHLEFLHDLEGVFRAKTEMLVFMPEDGTVIYNGDDAMLRKLACPQKLVSYGLGEDCAVKAADIEQLTDGRIRCRISYNGRSIKAEIPAYGQHMVYAALEGAAVGFVMGLSDEEIERGIAAYKTVGRRGVVTDTGFVTLVDDCYNANPDSMRCAVDSLMKLPGRHVCVLSDMREMGEGSAQMHRELGEYALNKGVDLVMAYGPMSKYLTEAMGSRGVYFETKAALVAALPEYIKKGDSVLVKASLGMHLEPAADAIKAMTGEK